MKIHLLCSQPAMLLTQGILVVTSATFLTTELTGSTAMYFVWVCAIFAAFSGIYSLQGPILVTLYGPRYFVFSLGVLSGTAVSVRGNVVSGFRQ